MYGAMTDKGWHIPAADPAKMDPQNIRQLVDDPTGETPGTLVVDTRNRFLYLVMERGKAMRYRVGVGKAGLEFEGAGMIGRKAAWPHWTPTADMIRREPEKYGNLQDGMDGGIDNPLGARALYLYKDGRDTLYRIHGTNQTWSIGKAVSSGCIRMLNQDVIDLASRVPAGSRVVVVQ
ncbi:L,D-transpeptidase [Afifella sp. IM 167]|nr:L,D-transpeptidase [Afifella sp. IM 167]